MDGIITQIQNKGGDFVNTIALLTLLEGILTKSPTVIADVNATLAKLGADKGNFVNETKDILAGALQALTDI